MNKGINKDISDIEKFPYYVFYDKDISDIENKDEKLKLRFLG